MIDTLEERTLHLPKLFYVRAKQFVPATEMMQIIVTNLSKINFIILVSDVVLLVMFIVNILQTIHITVRLDNFIRFPLNCANNHVPLYRVQSITRSQEDGDCRNRKYHLKGNLSSLKTVKKIDSDVKDSSNSKSTILE